MNSTTTIMFANQKGGVGKTSAVNEIGHILASERRKVLMIDLDAQCNLTECCNVKPKAGQSIYDAITGMSSFTEAIAKVRKNENEENDYLDILAGHRKMLSQYFANIDDITALKEAKKYIAEYKRYDYILIDVGPEAGQLMTMAMFASDYIIAVTTLSKLSYSGIIQMCYDLQKGKATYRGFDVKPLGILVNNVKKLNIAEFNKRKFIKLSKEFGAPLFETEIKSSCVVEECKEFSQSVNEFAPKHPVAKQYVQLANEIEERVKEGTLDVKLV